jgi:hypothetical protein
LPRKRRFSSPAKSRFCPLGKLISSLTACPQ